jgi:hypothetical protein
MPHLIGIMISLPSEVGQALPGGSWLGEVRVGVFPEVEEFPPGRQNRNFFVLRPRLLQIAHPLVITGLLLRVSGVTLLEKKYAGNPAYADYVRRTNAFVPWFPKK